jgi:hypothetical protein
MYSQPNLWELRGLPLGGDMCRLAFPCLFKCSPSKGGNSHRGPIILVMHVSGLHIDFRPTRN